MLTFLFIVSLLALLYFGIAKIANNLSLKKKAIYNALSPQERNKFNTPMDINLWSPKWFGVSAGTLFSLFVFFNLFVVSVGPQEVAVVKTPTGVKNTPLTAGWHMVWPWWDTYPMDKTVWVYSSNFYRKP